MQARGSAEPLSDAEQEAFRSRCRAFLDEHATGNSLDGESDQRGELRLRAARKFQKALADTGLAGLTYPVEYGGAGLTKTHERIWRDTYSEYPDMTFELLISQGMCLPMVAEYGSHDQKQKYLAEMISGNEVWCQMFSEPGAGSDVAGLQTRAERDGDEWVVNGQKVWITLAHLCDYGIIIARTDPTVPKHAGISMFIVPMDAPGVEVRPIHQIDGSTHFNEVFFSDARIGADGLLGDLNNGWRMATAMLMYERVAIGSGTTGGVTTDRSDRLIEEARKRGVSRDPNLRQKLMRLRTLETCLSLVAMRTRAEIKAGRTPGPGGSVGKLATVAIADLQTEVSLAITGASGVAWEDESDAFWQRQALASLSDGIAGGTTEIQRNIIGDRVLGLPRDVSVDSGIPYQDLKVGTQRA
ncbi:MAG: acyl-CoA dehydrogenase family protein [Acidimicrobiaceae bacterium]|nr:acyl-CoA dehydrogenase family protein [Acidimicrobiaceae bacterium]MCY4280073.1 acyl-CoA dehydrogenase family protein [Acidimicrobiaceae bacterium]MCY4294124.1 acyl-CoA dehydrogenase family protein [Acidimicrobiaceae bacterium]